MINNNILNVILISKWVIDMFSTLHLVVYYLIGCIFVNQLMGHLVCGKCIYSTTSKCHLIHSEVCSESQKFLEKIKFIFQMAWSFLILLTFIQECFYELQNSAKGVETTQNLYNPAARYFQWLQSIIPLKSLDISACPLIWRSKIA